MTQEEFKQELQKIEEFIKTPVEERPKYKEFHEQVTQMAEAEKATEYEPKWAREAYVWMANRKTLQRIQEEESEWYLHAAKVRTDLLFKKYTESLQSIV